ncbi:hypothetical protein [Herbaspirillum autotrophicum]|uniref:hypothetical protein n=1 Tax=Herbaspirillum autotrophicum TaxID=180195 RepID=UPI00067E2E69|nr:hypothetical protein [Herbaspirillum autotrophicum]
MKPVTISTYQCIGDEKRTENVLSVFVHPVVIRDEMLDDEIAPALSNHGPFERINFHGAPESITDIRRILQGQSSSFLRLRKGEPKISLMSWSNEPGGGFEAQTLDGTVTNSPRLVIQERRFSLFNVFEKNGGLVTASRGTHFTKPSGSHSRQFLRAANVFEQSAVSHQLVFWLYPLLRGKTIRRLIVDTSGIASIAYALAYERLRRGDAEALPAIESHASYGGLEKLRVTDPEGTIFLISASTSGKLASELIKRNAKKENIFTLFYLGDQTPGVVLCNLATDSQLDFKGLAFIDNYSQANCPDCKKHSYPIPIVGDQFRTEPAKVEEITVNLADFDENTRALLDKVVSTGLFKVYKTVENRQFELYLDVENMLKAKTGDKDARSRVKEISKRLNRLLQRGLPVHLKRIVPTSYPGTYALTKQAKTFVPEQLRGAVKIVAPQALLMSKAPDAGATLVVSACLDEASELMGISRDLRAVQPGGAITYVSPIFRFASDDERKRMESNLTYGDQGPKTFTQLSVLNLDLPRCEADHSWQKEFTRLNEVKYWFELEGHTTPASINERIELLRQAPATGLVDALFWPSPAGIQLKLAADFTMIATRDGARPVPQADIFAIVTTLFHKYRQSASRNRARLTSHTYERAVISPTTFSRFSDGILQAAFLRAAREGELAYGNCNEALSETMRDFLLGEVRAASHSGGHALMEYLIGMLIGRLTLHQSHALTFFQSIVESKLEEHHVVVAQYLKGELDGTIER